MWFNNGFTFATRFSCSSERLEFVWAQRDTVDMNSHYVATKPGISSSTPAPQSTRLLGQMCERLRYLHYSLRTEQTYVYWVRCFVHFYGLRHPREMGKDEVEAVSNEGSTYLKNACNAPSNVHSHRLRLPSPCLGTRCGIVLQRTCCKLAPTFARTGVVGPQRR